MLGWSCSRELDLRSFKYCKQYKAGWGLERDQRHPFKSFCSWILFIIFSITHVNTVLVSNPGSPPTSPFLLGRVWVQDPFGAYLQAHTSLPWQLRASPSEGAPYPVPTLTQRTHRISSQGNCDVLSQLEVYHCKSFVATNSRLSADQGNSHH